MTGSPQRTAASGAPSTPSPELRPELNSPDDLLLAVGRGDADAFALLYDAMAPRVYGTVLRILRDPHQSQEVVQEVLLQVWDGASRFDPERGSARAWVLTLAHRRAVDRVRTSEARQRRDTAYARAAIGSPFDETATAAHASIEAQAVRSALAVLTPLQRQSIELAYFGGFTHREVAGLMQAPLGTTKSRIREGLLQLREALVTVQPA